MPAFTQTIHASANGISLIEAADYAAMRGLLDLEPGVDVQEYVPNLADMVLMSQKATGASARFVKSNKSRMAMASNWNPGTKDVILACSVWVDTSTETQTVFCTGGTTNGEEGLCLQINSDGNVLLGFNDSVQANRLTATFTTNLQDAKWYHLCLFLNRNGTATLYLNGQADDVTLNIASHAASLGATGGSIGADLTPASWFDGRLDTLMIFEGADLAGVASDVALWTYNNGVGRLCRELEASYITLWGATHGWELGEYAGTYHDSWGTNDLTQVGQDLQTNGGFDSATTGWNALRSATLLSVAGGFAGNCLEVTNGIANFGGASQAIATVVNCVYTLAFYHKNGTASGAIKIGTTADGGEIYMSSVGLDDADWTLRTVSFVAPATTTYIDLKVNSNTISKTTLFDSVSLVASSVISGPGIHESITRNRLGFSNPILDKAAPGAIGATTPAAASFTTVSATGAVSVVSDTVGLKLDAAGGTTIISNGTTVAINKAMTIGGDLNVNGGTIYFGTAENVQTPTGTTATIDLGAENHHTLNCGSATDAITLTLTVPPGPCGGTIIVIQDDAAKDITWSPSSGSVVWLGTEPTWTSDTNKTRIVSWRWNATNLYLSATDTN